MIMVYSPNCCVLWWWSVVQSAEPILHCTSSRHTALLSALSSQLSSKCEGMQLQDQDSVTAMLGSVISALDLLTNARTQHLLLMKSSGRYLERIAISLLSHMAAAQVQCHRACIIKMAQCSSHRACIIKMAQCSSHRACSIVVMCTSWHGCWQGGSCRHCSVAAAQTCSSDF